MARSVGVIPIQAWSHSRLGTFEQCKYRLKLMVVDGQKEPLRPLRPGETERPNERGERVHRAAEAYVKGGVELVPELAKFREEFDRLRDLYAAGNVTLEGDWAFNREWEPRAWMSEDTWCRIKCDAVVLDDRHVVVIDYKTGKRYGNELKHAEQVRLYAVATFLKYADVDQVTVELWYTDQDEMESRTYSREDALKYLPSFTSRGERVTTETEFQPNPNAFSCRWCGFKPTAKGGNGLCSVGV